MNFSTENPLLISSICNSLLSPPSLLSCETKSPELSSLTENRLLRSSNLDAEVKFGPSKPNFKDASSPPIDLVLQKNSLLDSPLFASSLTTNTLLNATSRSPPTFGKFPSKTVPIRNALLSEPEHSPQERPTALPGTLFENEQPFDTVEEKRQSIEDIESDIEDALDDDDDELSEVKAVLEEIECSGAGESFVDPAKDAKIRFLNHVSGSLVASPKYDRPDDSARVALLNALNDIVDVEPEFVLKVALYARNNLNIRTTSNFLLAFAALQAPCRPFLGKYFNTVVRLPSDFVEVASLYSTLSSKRANNSRCPLPNALRTVMVGKFGDFDEYQLAKHNTNKKSNKKKVVKGPKGQVKSKLPAVTKLYDRPSPLNLKKLIRQLHVTRPAALVMALVGKRYPEDPVAFQHSGLLGVWDEQRAGKRMKLTVPITWETQIASRGNKAEVWQELLDQKKLPYMAMLRNLRNMIEAGISQEYHQQVLRRLQNEHQVINSRQFPFRFFSAYQVLADLREQLNKKDEPGRPRLVTAGRGRGRGARQSGMSRMQQKREMKTKKIVYEESLLRRYEKALDNALKIATAHNVKPIAGRTLVLCYVGQLSTVCAGAQSIGKTRTTLEVGILLGLMCKHACEDCRFVLYSHKDIQEVTLAPGTILQNMNAVLTKAEEMQAQEIWEMQQNQGKVDSKLLELLQTYTIDRVKIDNLLLLASCPTGPDDNRALGDFLRRYRMLVNNDILYVKVDLSPAAHESDTTSAHPNDVHLRGFSDQILRFVAERGNAGQLSAVQNVDKMYDLNVKPRIQPNPDKVARAVELAKPDLTLYQTVPNRTIRVFISSTFLDMHDERNLLLRFVFPHLQRKLAEDDEGSVTLCPIDLRWGVAEHHYIQQSSLEQCLAQVLRSDVLICLVGHRYGWSPPVEYLHKLAKDFPENYAWLEEFYKSNTSVTELETEQFIRRHPNAKEKVFFYVKNRSGAGKREKSESPTKQEQLRLFKARMEEAGYKMQSYSGTKNNDGQKRRLVELAKLVSADLRHVCMQTTNQTVDESGSMLDQALLKQWQFVRNGSADGSVCGSVIRQVQAESKQHWLVALTAKTGRGKTSAMMCLASGYIRGIVIPCFSDAFDESPATAATVRRYLTGVIGRISEFETDSDTMASWLEAVQKAALLGVRITFLMDGWDCGTLNSFFDSLPLAQNVHFIVSARDDSTLLNALRRLNCVQCALPTLSVDSRKLLVRGVLDKYGKRLNEGAFGNQLQLLVTKRQADNPGYLLLACEFLRLFGTFDNLSAQLRCLPSSADGLVREIVRHLEIDHGKTLVTALLSFVALSPGTLTEDDLYSLVSAARNIKTHTWHQPTLPRLQFQYLFSAAQTLICEDLSDGKCFHLRTEAVNTVVSKIYLSNMGQRLALHGLLAEFATFMCSAQRGSEFDRYAKMSMSCLVSLKDTRSLCDVLCSLEFIKRCFEAGIGATLLHYVEKTHKEIDTAKKHGLSDYPLSDLAQFITDRGNFLQVYPALTLQEIHNQPTTGYLRRWFDDEDDDDDQNRLYWANKPQYFSKCFRTQRMASSAVTSVVLSQNGERIAVGTSGGSVLVCCFASTEQLHSLTGHSGAVSALCFIDAQGMLLCSASKDSRMIIWDCNTGTRVAVLTDHHEAVSACCMFTWDRRSSLLSCSWDGSVRVWNPKKWRCAEEIATNSAVNCITCRSDAPFVAVGCWDATVKLYHMAPIKRKAVFRGHPSAVRAITFSEDGLQIISASMDGDIRVWSAMHGTQIGVFTGHHRPVTALSEIARQIVTVSEDSTVKIWSESLGVETWSSGGSVEKQTAASAVTLSDDRNLMAVGFSGGSVTMHSMKENDDEALWTRSWAPATILALEFTGKSLIVVTKDRVESLKLTNGQSELTFNTNEGGAVTSVSQAKGYVALTHAGGAVSVYSLLGTLWKRQREAQPELVAYQHEGLATDCAFAPDAMRLATVGRDRHLIVWNIGKLLSKKKEQVSEAHTVVRDCHNDWITRVAWSDTKPWIVTGGNDCSVKLWNADYCTLISSFDYHQGPVTSLSFKRSCIASASTDGSLCVLNARGGSLVTRIRTQTAPTCCWLALDSETSAVELDEVEDWATLVEQETGETQTATTNTNTQQVFVDARLVATFEDGQCKSWNPFSGNQQSSDSSHATPVLAVAAGPRSFVTGDKMGVCKWWKMDGSTVDVSANTQLPVVTARGGSPDQAFVCSGHVNGLVSVWSAQSAVVVVSAMLHTKRVVDVVWPSDDVLVSAAEDGMLVVSGFDHKLFKLTTINRVDLHSPVSAMAMAAERDLVVVLWNNHVQLLSTRNDWKKIDFFLATILEDVAVHSVHMFHTPLLLTDDGHVTDGLVSLENDVYLARGVSAVAMVGECLLLGTSEGQLHAVLSNRCDPISLRKIHNARVTEIVCLNAEDDGVYRLCTVSEDRCVKIWRFCADLENWTISLVGCWQAPSALNCAHFVTDSNALWCSDTLGNIHHLSLEAPHD